MWDENTKHLAHGPLRTDARDVPTRWLWARLLGYRWPAESDHTLALSAEAGTWVERCSALLPLADKDGIVCLPPVRGEATAAERLHNLLAAAYGPAWFTRGTARGPPPPNSPAAIWPGGSREVLRPAHRPLPQPPLIWHIWDGLRDGFGATVNYHRLDRKGLEALIYLGDSISRQKDAIRSKVDGARSRPPPTQKRLEIILISEKDYDIFVRWKTLQPAAQRLGARP